jgi:predicted aspartyl protease
MRDRNLSFLSLLLLLALAGAPAARGYTDNKPLRFDLYRDYLIVARGAAGSQKDLFFLLDTGTNPTVLDQRVADKLHLQQSAGVLAGINGRVQTALATLPSLQFGPIRTDNLPVVVEDLSFFEKTLSVRIDGVIGLDAIGQTPFEVDYAARKIFFGSIPPLKNALPLEMRGGLPVLAGELDHLPVQLVLDTGASSLILFKPKGQTSISKVSVVQRSSSMMGEFERRPMVLNSLTLAQTEFHHQPAFLVQSRWEGTQDFDGLVSPALLGINRLLIDPGRGVVEFTR